MKEFSMGIRYYFAATSFMAKNRLLYFYLIPLVLSILFQLFAAAAIVTFSQNIASLLLNDYIPESPLAAEGFSSILNVFRGNLLSTVTAIIIGFALFFLEARFSKYIILIILSPMFAYLAELTEEKITGNVYPFNFNRFMKDIVRGIIIALRNLMIELSLIGIFTIAGLFAGPFAILIVPLLWLVSAYFYGFSMMDYMSERRKMSIFKSVEFVRRHRMLAIANGGLYALFDLIPIIGLTIAPINAVVGATTSILELEKTNE